MATGIRSQKNKLLRRSYMSKRRDRSAWRHRHRSHRVKMETSRERSLTGYFEPGEVIELLSTDDDDVDGLDRVSRHDSSSHSSVSRCTGPPVRYSSKDKGKARQTDDDVVEQPRSRTRPRPVPTVRKSMTVTPTPSGASSVPSSSRVTLDRLASVAPSASTANTDDECEGETYEARCRRNVEQNRQLLEKLGLSRTISSPSRRPRNARKRVVPSSSEATPSGSRTLRRSQRRRLVCESRDETPSPSPCRLSQRLRTRAPVLNDKRSKEASKESGDYMYISDEPFDDVLEEEEAEKEGDHPTGKRMERGSYKWRQWRRNLVLRQEYDVQCHHCGRFASSPKMRCRKFVHNTVCQLQYCATCMQEHYPDLLFDLGSVDFVCPRCNEICKCDDCTEEQEESEEGAPQPRISHLAAQGWGRNDSDDEDDGGRRYNETDSDDDADARSQSSDDVESVPRLQPATDLVAFDQEDEWMSEYIDPRLL